VFRTTRSPDMLELLPQAVLSIHGPNQLAHLETQMRPAASRGGPGARPSPPRHGRFGTARGARRRSP
jgi:hypothetical protein